MSYERQTEPNPANRGQFLLAKIRWGVGLWKFPLTQIYTQRHKYILNNYMLKKK